MSFRKPLTCGSPQSKTLTPSITHGTQARRVSCRARAGVSVGLRRLAAPGPSGRWVAVDGASSRSCSKRQIDRGCQNRTRNSSDPIETSEARMSTSSGPMKLETRNWTRPKEAPAVSAAGQTSRVALRPASAQTSQKGTIRAKNGSWRPTIALRVSTGRLVTPARVRIGVPMAPNATGAVLPISDSPAAGTGRKPSPISMAALIATGVPNPADPSRKAPKQNAIKRTWMRRSDAIPAIEPLTTSNAPVATVMSYTNIAVSTIQPMGNNPKSAPLTRAAVAIGAGTPYTSSATSKAVAKPASAA
jgi:hypothetical protein